jgi:hypothetical protein
MNQGSHLQLFWSQSPDGISLRDVFELTLRVDALPINDKLLPWLSQYSAVRRVVIVREQGYIPRQQIIPISDVITCIGRWSSHPILFLPEVAFSYITETDMGRISELYLFSDFERRARTEYEPFFNLQLEHSLVTKIGIWIVPGYGQWTNYDDMQMRCLKKAPCDRITMVDDIIENWEKNQFIDNDRLTVAKKLMVAMHRNKEALRAYYDACVTMMIIFVKRGGMDRFLCRYFLAVYLSAADWRTTKDRSTYPAYVKFVRDSYEKLQTFRNLTIYNNASLQSLKREKEQCEKRLREIPDEIAKKEEAIAKSGPETEAINREFADIVQYAKKARKGGKPRRGKYQFF